LAINWHVQTAAGLLVRRVWLRAAVGAADQPSLLLSSSDHVAASTAHPVTRISDHRAAARAAHNGVVCASVKHVDDVLAMPAGSGARARCSAGVDERVGTWAAVEVIAPGAT
jgi:hypothetical protein